MSARRPRRAEPVEARLETKKSYPFPSSATNACRRPAGASAPPAILLETRRDRDGPARRARTVTADAEPTIYAWGGGREAFARWLNRFYDLIEEESPDIAALFGGRVSEAHRAHVTEWWCEVMGGPPAYTEHHGGYEHMLSRHRGLAITPAQRLQFVTLLSRAADDAELPADPEFRAALMGYAEWGTRLALHNSQPGADTAPHAPVPRWGWGVAPPYEPSG